MDEKTWKLLIDRINIVDEKVDDSKNEIKQVISELKDEVKDLQKFRWIHAGVMIAFTTLLSSGIVSVVLFILKS